jgi:hypothetical protein
MIHYQTWPLQAIHVDASYQVLVHFVGSFRDDFLDIDQSETRIACGGHVC